MTTRRRLPELRSWELIHRFGQASTACIWLDVPEVCWEMAGGESLLGMAGWCLLEPWKNDGTRSCIAEESVSEMFIVLY